MCHYPDASWTDKSTTGLLTDVGIYHTFILFSLKCGSIFSVKPSFHAIVLLPSTHTYMFPLQKGIWSSTDCDIPHLLALTDFCPSHSHSLTLDSRKSLPGKKMKVVVTKKEKKNLHLLRNKFCATKKSDFPFCPSALSWDFSLCFMTVQ